MASIAVCSDIHDNIWALERALVPLKEADYLLFCGDFCSPFTLVQLAEGFTGPIHIVWGNNDGDKWLLTKQAARFKHLEIHGEFADIEIAGVHIGINHYPEIAKGLVLNDQYDLLCYGHDHKANQEKIHDCLLLNPGELMGRFGNSQFALYDTNTREACYLEI